MPPAALGFHARHFEQLTVKGEITESESVGPEPDGRYYVGCETSIIRFSGADVG
jgi:hypothetical protein